MFIASLALSAAFTTMPAQYAYAGAAPVRVASCTLDSAASAYLPFGPFNAPSGSSTVISFVNEAPATVSSVTFNVTDGRTTSQIVDRGTFSNGVAIENHRFTTPEFQNDTNDVSCSVTSVAFTDGSIWQAQ
jgi:hypothetical protein